VSRACPACPGALEPSLDGSHVCTRCYGLWRDTLDNEALTAHPDAQRGAASKDCPDCRTPLMPHQIAADAHAFVYRCEACARDFVGSKEQRALDRLAKLAQIKARYDALDDDLKAQYAGALAGTTHSSAERVAPPVVGLDGTEDDLGTGAPRSHLLFRLFGLPQVHYGTLRVPLITPLLAVVLVVFHLAADKDAWSYVAAHDSIVQTVRCLFVHVDGWHLAGNLYFLLVFGAGAEAKLPRVVYAAWLLLGGAAGAFVEGLIQPEVAILGASGMVAVAMGICFVLQRRTPVTIPVVMLPLATSMLVFGGVEVLYQLGSALAGREGVAWFGHLVGIAFGVALGMVAGDEPGDVAS
jgi:membrane associated rhomboid family serine protease